MHYENRVDDITKPSTRCLPDAPFVLGASASLAQNALWSVTGDGSVIRNQGRI